jgi:3-hydroxyisobutyrate dehydrogenase-like beta-hydroxyacid dehydrogenase
MAITRVGFIGTGLMGTGMARNLAQKGFRVKAWNRTAARAQALAAEGVEAVADPASAARGAEAVVGMLSDTRALAEVLDDGLAGALSPGTFFVDASTSAPSESIALAERLRQAGVLMLDTPVFGSKNNADAGELTFLVGGERAAYDACVPLLAAMGTRTFYLGGNGLGCQAKLVFNMVIAGTIQAFAEGLAMGRAAGMDPKTLVDIIMAGRARSGIIEMKAGPMIARDYTPFFALKHMKKDLDLIARTGEGFGLRLPMAVVLQELYTEALAAGQAELDFCSIAETLETRRVGGAKAHVE